MNARRTTVVTSLSMLAVAGFANAGEPSKGNWPQFRGPAASGVADGFATPTTWDVPGGKGVRWKTPIPGLAHSSPIVWGDKLFVTTAVSSDPNPYLKVGLYGESPKHEEKVDHEFKLFCLDKKSGKVVWEQTAYKGVPKTMRHIKATHANCTPATDGKYIVAYFGSEGLYGYDLDGKLLWNKDLGTLDAGPTRADEIQWGIANSPIVHEGKVILLVSARNESYLTAMNAADGKEIWRTSRVIDPCWCTPAVHESPTRKQVIVNGYKHIGGYDLNTGAELWKMTGGGDVPVPTPIIANDLIYITNAHGDASPVYAIRTSATGDISQPAGETSNSHIAWAQMKIGNYMQTPLVYGDRLYCCRDSGILAVYDAKTGEKKYRERLANGVGFTASPVAADGKVYFSSEEGDVYVVAAGDDFRVLATNKLGEICMASPAVSDGTLFFRTQGHVVAIGN
jgi:outer membrane protein assembly factor BamB